MTDFIYLFACCIIMYLLYCEYQCRMNKILHREYRSQEAQELDQLRTNNREVALHEVLRKLRLEYVAPVDLNPAFRAE